MQRDVQSSKQVLHWVTRANQYSPSGSPDTHISDEPARQSTNLVSPAFEDLPPWEYVQVGENMSPPSLQPAFPSPRPYLQQSFTDEIRLPTLDTVVGALSQPWPSYGSGADDLHMDLSERPHYKQTLNHDFIDGGPLVVEAEANLPSSTPLPSSSRPSKEKRRLQNREASARHRVRVKNKTADDEAKLEALRSKGNTLLRDISLLESLRNQFTTQFGTNIQGLGEGSGSGGNSGY